MLIPMTTYRMYEFNHNMYIEMRYSGSFRDSARRCNWCGGRSWDNPNKMITLKGFDLYGGARYGACSKCLKKLNPKKV